ncbi:MAG TPA: GyrI-like domain-containing protein [Oscillospiraceae bacterium]|nr:GyrI-like domain-containing protein [Oscillospiraceae bacterium]
MNYKIEKIPQTRVAYMRQTAPYGAANYALMEKLKQWAKAEGLFTKSAVIFGIAQDNPAVTPPEKCRYDVCIVLPESYAVTSNEVKETTLLDGKYVVFTIDHTAEAMQTAWNEIFIQLSNLGHSMDSSRPILERYSVAMIEQQLCEICVPV